MFFFLRTMIISVAVTVLRTFFIPCWSSSHYLLLCRILAPTTYIFFASAIPVISFGEQLERNTGKSYFFLFFLECLCTLVSLFQCHFSNQMHYLITYYRWNFNCSSNSRINGPLWCHPLNYWRTTLAHTRSCWTNSIDVYIHVWLCEGQEGFGEGTLFSMDRMVSPQHSLYVW